MANQSMELGMQDPNNMQAPNQSAGGKTKINKTDTSGESGGPTGASFNESLASSKKSMMPSEGGDEMGNITKSATILEYGDPNNAAGNEPGAFPGR